MSNNLISFCGCLFLCIHLSLSSHSVWTALFCAGERRLLISSFHWTENRKFRALKCLWQSGWGVGWGWCCCTRSLMFKTRQIWRVLSEVQHNWNRMRYGEHIAQRQCMHDEDVGICLVHIHSMWCFFANEIASICREWVSDLNRSNDAQMNIKYAERKANKQYTIAGFLKFRHEVITQLSSSDLLSGSYEYNSTQKLNSSGMDFHIKLKRWISKNRSTAVENLK